MLFNSYEFIFLFLPISLLGYVMLARYASHGVSLAWLVVASLFFYGWWNPAYLGLIIGSMIFNYSLGSLLSARDELKNKKVVLIIGIVANLALLAYYKYYNFFVDNINTIFNAGWNVENIILPLAISFFTFQQITYLVDTYRGETKEYDFLQYALFVSFFPQLIAGPIVHHKEMMPQFSKTKRASLNYGNISIGLSIFFIGLFKKVAIADSMSSYVSDTFSAVSSGVMLSFFEAWHGVLAYTFQLYFDFSGYSDMAVGIAFLFGIRLPLNFNSPYQSSSIIEFWQRWHITLSRFLRDYLYIPLGGNRKGNFKRYRNLMVTMLLGGLWHGAGWTFIIWGGLHGLYLVINHGWRHFKQLFKVFNSERRIYRYTSRLLTFFVVSIAWVYFRADSVSTANMMVQSLLGYGGIAWPEGTKLQYPILASTFESLGMQYRYLEYFNGMDHLLQMLALTGIVWSMPNVYQIFHHHSAVLNPPVASRLRWSPNKKWLGVIILIAVISILKLGQVSEFLYFQF